MMTSLYGWFFPSEEATQGGASGDSNPVGVYRNEVSGDGDSDNKDAKTLHLFVYRAYQTNDNNLSAGVDKKRVAQICFYAYSQDEAKARLASLIEVYGREFIPLLNKKLEYNVVGVPQHQQKPMQLSNLTFESVDLSSCKQFYIAIREHYDVTWASVQPLIDNYAMFVKYDALADSIEKWRREITSIESLNSDANKQMASKMLDSLLDRHSKRIGQLDPLVRRDEIDTVLSPIKHLRKNKLALSNELFGIIDRIDEYAHLLKFSDYRGSPHPLYETFCDTNTSNIVKGIGNEYDPNMTLWRNITPLMFAVARPTMAGVSINASKDHWTQVTQALLKADANVNATDKDGRTALMYIAIGRKLLGNSMEFGREAFTKMLLDAGADVDIVDNNGKTALDYFEEFIGKEHPATVLIQNELGAASTVTP